MPAININDISFLHLDCDLYGSYKTCLQYLHPKLSNKAIVLYDEYNHPKWPGATKAINESFNEKERILMFSKLCNKYLSIDYDTLNSDEFEELKKELILEKVEK